MWATGTNLFSNRGSAFGNTDMFSEWGILERHSLLLLFESVSGSPLTLTFILVRSYSTKPVKKLFQTQKEFKTPNIL